MKKPELLSPAGTLRNMRYAFAYGADAVYAGLPRYSLRVRNNDFLEDNLRIGIAEAHARGRQFFVAANAMPHGAKLKGESHAVHPCKLGLSLRKSGQFLRASIYELRSMVQ